MRFTRISVAVAAAAMWAAPMSGPANADTINGNRLYFDKPVPATTWFAESPTSAGTFVPIDPNLFRIVPGDTVELRADVMLRATGPASGRLTVVTAGITPDNDLRRALTVTTTTSIPSGTIVSEKDADKPIAVKVRVYFDPTTPGKTAQNTTVHLGKTVLRIEGDDVTGPGDGGTTTKPQRPSSPPKSVGPGGLLPPRDVPNRVPINSVPAGPVE